METKDEMVGWHHQLTDMSLSKLREIVKDREAWHAAVHRNIYSCYFDTAVFRV